MHCADLVVWIVFCSFGSHGHRSDSTHFFRWRWEEAERSETQQLRVQFRGVGCVGRIAARPGEGDEGTDLETWSTDRRLTCTSIIHTCCCCCYRLAVASPRCDHGWQHASRGLQVKGCYLSGADRPICYVGSMGDIATDCLVVDRAIGWCDCWVPYGLERCPAVWLYSQKNN